MNFTMGAQAEMAYPYEPQAQLAAIVDLIIL